MTTEPKSPPPPPATSDPGDGDGHPANGPRPPLGRDDPSLLDQVDRLSRQLTELREEVERLAERTVYSTVLTTLASPDYQLLRDIPITVEQDEDETIVSWFEIGLSGVEDTHVGALMSFEDRLLRLFTDLNAKPDSELGPLPSRWKRTLATAIRRV